MRKYTCSLCGHTGHHRNTCLWNEENVPWTVARVCHYKKQATVYTVYAPNPRVAISRAQFLYGVHRDYCAVAPVT